MHQVFAERAGLPECSGRCPTTALQTALLVARRKSWAKPCAAQGLGHDFLWATSKAVCRAVVGHRPLHSRKPSLRLPPHKVVVRCP